MLEFSAPGEPGYDTATRVFNLTAPARPDLAVTVRSVAEVRAAVRRASAEGLPVRVQSTGHASAAVRPIDDGLLIQTRLDGEVTVDPERRVAVIPAGTSWGAVVPAAAAHGLAAPHGSSELVGAVGYLLRGGLSFYGRKTGLAVNSVLAVELVTADGTLRRVDADTPDFFWALRGGGGGFGVVTSIEVALFPAATLVSGGAYWRAEHAEELLSIWRDWSLTAPDEATTSVRVMNLPPAPDVPPVLAEGPVFCVDGVFLGDAGAAQYAELLGALRAVADPVLDHWAPGSTADVLEAHMDPGEPMPFVGDHFLLSEFGSDGMLAYLDAVGGRSPLVAAGLRQLGGAFARPAADGGVLSHFDAAYAYLGAGIPDGPEADAAIRECNAKVRAALAPWDTGVTAPSLVEAFAQPQGHLSPDQVAAVDVVRADVDPDGLFLGDVMPGATALGGATP